jgi:hypothetical protein
MQEYESVVERSIILQELKPSTDQAKPKGVLGYPNLAKRGHPRESKMLTNHSLTSSNANTLQRVSAAVRHGPQVCIYFRHCPLFPPPRHSAESTPPNSNSASPPNPIALVLAELLLIERKHGKQSTQPGFSSCYLCVRLV